MLLLLLASAQAATTVCSAVISRLKLQPTTDGRHVRVILRTDGETRLTTVDVETSEVTSEGVVPLQGNVVVGIALSPEARQVVYLRGRQRTELKVMLEP